MSTVNGSSLQFLAQPLGLGGAMPKNFSYPLLINTDFSYHIINVPSTLNGHLYPVRFITDHGAC